jgi:protein SCO1
LNNRIIILTILVSLGIIGVSLYIMSTLDVEPKPKPTAEITNIISGKSKVTDDFTLHDTYDKEFNISNLKNKFSLVYFGFARCPDLCPYTLNKFREAASLLAVANIENIQFIFVSIDPERDDNLTLRGFAQESGGKDVIAVTGSEVELDKLVNSLKAYYAKDDKKNDKNYYVDHTSFVYLINPEAELITQFSQSASGMEIANKVKEEVAAYK